MEDRYSSEAENFTYDKRDAIAERYGDQRPVEKGFAPAMGDDNRSDGTLI